MELLSDGPREAEWTVVLAHGAGAPMDSPFMNTVAVCLGERDHRCLRFEFPYMSARREDGRRRPPNPQACLLEAWREAVAAAAGRASRLIIGGKSMGGRMASLLADELGVAGLICLGYPFHPAGKPERLRTEHLEALCTPTLIVQGERDPLGKRAEVEGYALSSAIRLHWCCDGDHDLKPRKASGTTQQANLASALDAVEAFIDQLR
ncbi:MAG: alpha/beta family hydrolase [Pseudomonadota bacterium]